MPMKNIETAAHSWSVVENHLPIMPRGSGFDPGLEDSASREW